MARASSRRSGFRLVINTLETRITPATGPYSLDYLLSQQEGGAASFRFLDTLPASPTGAERALDFKADAFEPLAIDLGKLTTHLANAPQENEGGERTVLALPTPDGGFSRFNVWEVDMMEPGLAALFPDIRTWRGQGIDDPTATLAADVTMHGFHAQVLSPVTGRWYVDPIYRLDTSAYASYYAVNLIDNNGGFIEHEDPESHGHDHDEPDGDHQPQNRLLNGETLRTYRTAVAATGEYTAFHGGTVNAGQAAIVTSVNRVSGVYEKELSIRMILVANNNLLVYTNAGSDPYTNNNGSAMLAQNQSTVDSIIGNANYDLGHVYSTGGGGIAGLGVVGVTGQKARGVTGQGAPIGDPFDIDYVAHEMGHQFDGNHTFNFASMSSGTNYEPGSGSTIQAYAGITGPTSDLQPNSDAYFHFASLDEMSSYVNSGAGVGNTQTPTNNAIPVANAGADFVIPARTPFELTGSGTDGNAGDVLTYTWEQMNIGPAQANLSDPDNGSSALFRSRTGTTNPTRTYPLRANFGDNSATGQNLGDKLPTVNWAAMRFRLTVRDNRTTGAFDFDEMQIQVVDTGSAFAVTSPNTNVNYTGNTTQTVTWTVAGTTAAPINAANVNILLSTDGGTSYSMLAANVPNDGSHDVVIPNLTTTTARIKVQAAGGIFFDVSNVNFRITASPAPTVANVTSSSPDNTYSNGQAVSIQVVFSEAVAVTGTPQLALNSGGTATYASGSGSATLTFNYVVGSGQQSPDLDYTASNSLALNGGTIRGVAAPQDNANLLLPAPGAIGSLGANKNIVIDADVTSTITNVTSPTPNGSYSTPGTVIPVTVQFDRPVTVSGGTPSIALNSGGTAIYASGSGTATLTFNYTLASGDATADLNYTSSAALALNGATIIDQGSGATAVTTLPAPAGAGSLGTNKNITITAPVIPVVTGVNSPTANGTYGNGQSVLVAVTFDRTVNVTGSPSIALNSGGTATYTSGSGTATLTFTYVVGTGDGNADLDYTSTGALVLNGGTIQDVASGANATLTLPAPGAAGSLGANKNIVIDSPSVTLLSSSILVDEDNDPSTLTISVARGGGGFGAVSAQYTVLPGTGSAADFSVTSSPTALTWGPGDLAPKSIVIEIAADALSEGRETVLLALTNVTGAQPGIDEATLTIEPSDGKPLGTFTYSDGDAATLKLNGGGTGLVYLTDDVAPISLIRVAGTDPLKSVLSMKVKKSRTSTDSGTVEIQGVEGTGLKLLNLSKAVITGDGIRLPSPALVIKADSLVGGADIVTQGTAIPRKSTKILLKNAIEDGSDVTVATPLGKLVARSMGNGTVTAPSIGTLLIKGNLTGDIDVTGVGVTLGDPAVKVLKVLGTADGVTVDVTGSINAATFGSFLNSRFNVGYSGDDLGNGTYDGTAEIKKFTVTGKTAAFADSSLIAANIGKVTLGSIDTVVSSDPYGVFASTGIDSLVVKGLSLKLKDPQSYTFGDFRVEVG